MLKGSQDKTILNYKLHWVGDIILITTALVIFTLLLTFFATFSISTYSEYYDSSSHEYYKFSFFFTLSIILMIIAFALQSLSFLLMYKVETYKMMPAEGKITSALLHSLSTLFLLLIMLTFQTIVNRYFPLFDFYNLKLGVRLFIAILLVLQVFTLLLLFKSNYFKLQK